MSKRNKRGRRGQPSPTDIAYEQDPDQFLTDDDMAEAGEKLQEHFDGASRHAQVPKKHMKIAARSENQQKLLDAARQNDITFCLAPAGTGKTFLAAYLAIEALVKGEVDEIIMTRPAIGGQESNGYLPGGIDEKLGPTVAPVISHLEKILGNGDRWKGAPILKKLREQQIIRILPFEYMRGVDIERAFVVGDELQNATHEQTKMLLTRIGEASKFVLVGDPEQTDLDPVELSGFKHAADTIQAQNLEGIGYVEMGEEDIVRHRLIGPMLQALRDNPPEIPNEPRRGNPMPTARTLNQP